MQRTAPDCLLDVGRAVRQQERETTTSRKGSLIVKGEKFGEVRVDDEGRRTSECAGVRGGEGGVG